MIVLAIETSCDETAVAILRDETLLASEVASQIDLHAIYGGVVPEVASRNHLRTLRPVLDAALARADIALADVNVFAATRGPGLATSLMIGLSAAKGLAVGFGKPFIGVNHIEGHLLSPFFGHGGVRPAVGLVVPITALVAPSGIGNASLGILPVDEISASFTEVANNIGGDGTVVERLEAIEATMRDDFSLDPGAPGGGMQLALIQRFLTETRRGNAEQFATAFVLMARSLGVNARVATGFVVPPDELDDRVELRSDLAVTWPEVEVIGEGWVAFDPVPEEEAASTEEPVSSGG